MKIAIDGFALGIRKGTGLSTYALELANLLTSNDHTLSILYGLNGVGNIEELRWPRLLQALSMHGEPASRQWQSWLPRALAYFPLHLAGQSLTAKPVSRAAASGVNLIDSRFPPADHIYNIPSLYRAAQAHQALLKTPLRVRKPADTELFHATSPLPITVENVPNVVTIHDTIPFAFPQSTPVHLKTYKRLLMTALQQADQVFTVSEHSRKDLLSLTGIPAHRVHVTYQAVEIAENLLHYAEDELKNYLQNSYQLEAGNYFLFYGAIEPKKNVMRILEAYALAKTRRPLVVAGQYAWFYKREKRYFESLQATPSSGKRIIRLQHQPYQQLMLLLKGARGLVFPSLYEGFGLPVLEAMTMGTPVITSNTSALTEIAADAALKVDPSSSHEIARAMDQLDRDGNLAAELVTRGHERAEFFSPQQHYQRLLEGYHLALNQ